MKLNLLAFKHPKRYKFRPCDFEVNEFQWGLVRLRQSKLCNPPYPLPQATETQLNQWNDERKFIEQIAYTRFAHLLGLCAATVAGVINVHSDKGRIWLLIVAIIVLTPLVLAINRSYAKAAFLGACVSAYGYQPVSVVDAYFHRSQPVKRFRGVESFWLVAALSPILIAFLLLAALTYFSYEVYTAPRLAPPPKQTRDQGGDGTNYAGYVTASSTQ